MPLYRIEAGPAGWDEHDSAVIRARDEQHCRQIASEKLHPRGQRWLDPNRSEVEQVSAEGEYGIVVASFNAG